MTVARFEASRPWDRKVLALPTATADSPGAGALVRRPSAVPDIRRPAGFGWGEQEWTRCADSFTATTAGAGALVSALMAAQGQNLSCLVLALLSVLGVGGQSLVSSRRKRLVG